MFQIASPHERRNAVLRQKFGVGRKKRKSVEEIQVYVGRSDITIEHASLVSRNNQIFL